MPAVRYHPEIAQRDLAESFDRPFDALLPLGRLHEGWSDGGATWSGLAELGLFGIALPEDAGGVGLGAVEEVLIAERLGRRLACPAVFATMAAAHTRPEGSLTVSLCTGGLRIAPAWRSGADVVAADAGEAAFLLLRNGDSAALYPAGEMRSIDDRLWTTMLVTSSTPLDPVALLDDVALLRARLIDAAALAGIAGAACDMAVAYAQMREQFGRPIGGFQAIKHFCADMAMAARAAADQTSFAAVAIDDARADAALQVECALLLAMQAALGNARTNIQVHGGIGFSDEADPHLLLKRAHLHAAIAGGAEAAARRVASAAPAL